MLKIKKIKYAKLKIYKILKLLNILFYNFGILSKFINFYQFKKPEQQNEKVFILFQNINLFRQKKTYSSFLDYIEKYPIVEYEEYPKQDQKVHTTFNKVEIHKSKKPVFIEYFNQNCFIICAFSFLKSCEPILEEVENEKLLHLKTINIKKFIQDKMIQSETEKYLKINKADFCYNDDQLISCFDMQEYLFQIIQDLQKDETFFHNFQDKTGIGKTENDEAMPEGLFVLMCIDQNNVIKKEIEIRKEWFLTPNQYVIILINRTSLTSERCQTKIKLEENYGEHKLKLIYQYEGKSQKSGHYTFCEKDYESWWFVDSRYKDKEAKETSFEEIKNKSQDFYLLVYKKDFPKISQKTKYVHPFQNINLFRKAIKQQTLKLKQIVEGKLKKQEKSKKLLVKKFDDNEFNYQWKKSNKKSAFIKRQVDSLLLQQNDKKHKDQIKKIMEKKLDQYETNQCNALKLVYTKTKIQNIIYNLTDKINWLYYGELVDKDVFNGTVCYKNGDCFQGKWEKGQKHGKGKMIFKNAQTKSSFEGMWKNNLFCEGTVSYVNGDTYVGEWKNDKRHGQGNMYYKNQDTYQGEWQNNSYHGKGKMEWEQKAYYGDWKNNMRDGFGVQYQISNGLYYMGGWKEDKRYGFGIKSTGLEQVTHSGIFYENHQLKFDLFLKKDDAVFWLYEAPSPAGEYQQMLKRFEEILKKMYGKYYFKVEQDQYFETISLFTLQALEDKRYNLYFLYTGHSEESEIIVKEGNISFNSFIESILNGIDSALNGIHAKRSNLKMEQTLNNQIELWDNGKMNLEKQYEFNKKFLKEKDVKVYIIIDTCNNYSVLPNFCITKTVQYLKTDLNWSVMITCDKQQKKNVNDILFANATIKGNTICLPIYAHSQAKLISIKCKSYYNHLTGQAKLLDEDE